MAGDRDETASSLLVTGGDRQATGSNGVLTSEQDRRKANAADLAVTRIEPGMTVGLGTGSTADLVTRALGRMVGSGFQIIGVPTSRRTAELARSMGIPLRDLQEVERIDLTIDGADEIQPGTLHALKGAGGALLREKLVAVDSSQVILVVDDTKIVDVIGSHFSVPVEVVPFGWRVPARGLERLGARIELRADDHHDRPFVTDNDNYVIDASFGPIEDPVEMSRRIKEITGVIEHGLFVNVASEVIVGREDGVDSMTPER